MDASEVATDLLLDEVAPESESKGEEAATLVPATDEATAPTRVPSPSADEARVTANGTGGKLIEEEKRAEGRVKGAVYGLYLKSAGYETWVAIVLLIFAGRAFREWSCLNHIHALLGADVLLCLQVSLIATGSSTGEKACVLQIPRFAPSISRAHFRSLLTVPLVSFRLHRTLRASSSILLDRLRGPDDRLARSA